MSPFDRLLLVSTPNLALNLVGIYLSLFWIRKPKPAYIAFGINALALAFTIFGILLNSYPVTLR